MDIRIDKKSEVAVGQQLIDQVIFSIATEKLRPGETLPSVRQLSRSLKIHRNTVCRAYLELKRRSWLVGRRGSRVVVRGHGRKSLRKEGKDLDHLINATIQTAREQGFTLQELSEFVEKRLRSLPPDRILVVEQDPGLRSLLREEIRVALHQPIEGCALTDLASNPSLAIGALTVAAQYAIDDVELFTPKSRPAIPLAFSTANDQLGVLRRLRKPSIIGIVSVSEALLKTARSLLAPELGQSHTLRVFHFPLDQATAFKAVDLVFADSIVHHEIKHTQVIPYRLIRPSSLEYLVGAMKSYKSV